MIKIALKGIEGTICERYFKTWDSAYAWLDWVPYDEKGAIGYTIEGDDE